MGGFSPSGLTGARASGGLTGGLLEKKIRIYYKSKSKRYTVSHILFLIYNIFQFYIYLEQFEGGRAPSGLTGARASGGLAGGLLEKN